MLHKTLDSYNKHYFGSIQENEHDMAWCAVGFFYCNCLCTHNQLFAHTHNFHVSIAKTPTNISSKKKLQQISSILLFILKIWSNLEYLIQYKTEIHMNPFGCDGSIAATASKSCHSRCALLAASCTFMDIKSNTLYQYYLMPAWLASNFFPSQN